MRDRLVALLVKNIALDNCENLLIAALKLVSMQHINFLLFGHRNFTKTVTVIALQMYVDKHRKH